MANGKRLVNDAQAINSLRSNDFDAVSAYGEAIDNALDAGAKNVRVQFDTVTRPRSHYQDIERVAFGDDGHGMDLEALGLCLQLGWSDKYNGRQTIGRFGVGMTLGAIHECKKIEVWSSAGGNNWLATEVDLDLVARDGEAATIPVPTKRVVPKDLKALVPGRKGTLVVWSKYDRQIGSGDKIIEETRHWAGRTYRYFIWEQDVTIAINGAPVHAFDPLFRRTDKTRFEDDPVAELFPDDSFAWPVDKTDLRADELTEEELPITIRMSCLPEDWRVRSGEGGDRHALDRWIPDNEGISILRNKREVFYGHVPHWKAAGPGWPVWEDPDRWWGCEVEFDARQDRAFTVKNIKRGADPTPDLKKALKGRIKFTRDTVLARVRNRWKLTEVDDEKKSKRPHGQIEKIAGRVKVDKTDFHKGKDPREEAAKLAEDERFKEFSQRERDALATMFEAQPFTIEETTWSGTKFLEARHFGGKAALLYNRNHPFWIEVYRLLDELAKGTTPPPTLVKDLKQLMDLLLISYAKAEGKFGEDEEMTAEDWVEHLQSNWGSYLFQYSRHWKKEKGLK